MPADANHAPSSLSASCGSSAPGSLWLVFYVFACSVLGAVLGRLVPHAFASPSDSLAEDHPFAIYLRLIAMDWFRRFRSAPATPEQLLRRSLVAQAVLALPLDAPVLPCDRPGETPAPGSFAPAFASRLAGAPASPLSLAPSSPLLGLFAALSPTARPALSTRNRALFTPASTGSAATPPVPQPASFPPAFRISHSALEYSALARAPG